MTWCVRVGRPRFCRAECAPARLSAGATWRRWKTGREYCETVGQAIELGTLVVQLLHHFRDVHRHSEGFARPAPGQARRRTRGERTAGTEGRGREEEGDATAR
jgi:hypothetical protein